MIVREWKEMVNKQRRTAESGVETKTGDVWPRGWNKYWRWIVPMWGQEMKECSGRLVLRKISVFEAEVALLSLAPRPFPIEVNVYALFILLGDGLGLGVALEPCEILHVETP